MNIKSPEGSSLHWLKIKDFLFFKMEFIEEIPHAQFFLNKYLHTIISLFLSAPGFALVGRELKSGLSLGKPITFD